MNPLSHNRNFVETRESENENRQTPTPPARFVKRAVKHPAPAPAARRVREPDNPSPHRIKRGGNGNFPAEAGINSEPVWETESGPTERGTLRSAARSEGSPGGRYFFRRSVNFVDTSVKRGDIYYADLSPVVGSEQGGVRPVLIIQNDTGNRYSPTVIAAAITSQTGKAKLPTHIDLPVNANSGLSRNSVILLEQIRTLDKKRLRERMGHVEENMMTKVDAAIAVSFGLPHDQLV